MKTASIRKAFLDFFAQAGHEIVPSSPLIPHNDPSLMFTAAGMVPFKNIFTGHEKRPYVRAASSQKCVRAGGKHNDLENVGHTARHHTFFEMLGNFSFGDYFKDLAIELSWKFITQELQIDAKRLYVTVFHEDDEAAQIWKKIANLSDERIIRIATSDNFWTMGPTGPCGPCSEIFYDHGDHILGGLPGTPEQDGDRFVEIWNLVFMQFDQQSDGSRLALPKPSIDTGMGLERISAVMQGTHDNYRTDILRSIIEASAQLSHQDVDGPHSISHRVIADHLRATAFLIADGVLPSNEGRGYVLRRIMRRAMRHAHNLGCQEPFIYQLAPVLIQQMGEPYHELVRAQSLITETIRLEEERFQKTLDRGLKLLQEETAALKRGESLSGMTAFKLYDTYGFPLDLTQDILKAEERTVDVEGFEAAMQNQKQLARQSWVGSGEKADEAIWLDVLDKHGPTEFLGYTKLEAQGHILAIIRDGKLCEHLSQGESAEVVFNQTPFYAESGGQQGDHGIMTHQHCIAVVADTVKKAQGLHVHKVRVTEGQLQVGQALTLTVNAQRRQDLRAHHSATHLLHKALRKHLGDHVVQKGSLVAEDKLRFDFSHHLPLTHEQIRLIEQEVNTVARKAANIHTALMTPHEAIAKGALALFGEKYGDEVRVVSMGTDEDDHDFSVELCGGTHVHNTGEIGMFKIISESGVAAGVRRIEAVSGRHAEHYVRNIQETMVHMGEILKCPQSELAIKLEKLIEERKKLEKDLKQAKIGSNSNQDFETFAKEGYTVLFKSVSDVSPQDLKGIVDQVRSSISNSVIILLSQNEEKSSLVVGLTTDLANRINAVDVARRGAELLGGKGGGGRPDMAQAGGQAVNDLESFKNDLIKCL